MRIGLIGWGVETQSAFRYFGSEHNYLICNEEPRDDFPSGDNIDVQFVKTKRTPGLVGNVSDLSYLDGVETCDQIIFAGSTRKNLERHFDENGDFWQKAKTIQHIFFEKSPTKNIIGVTGSKGKGTTSTLIAKMLDADGKKTCLGGNIGLAVLDMLPSLTPESWVVLELSSFQLYKFPYSPHIAVHLTLWHEHIEEWHKTMEDYVSAKSNIFAHQVSTDIAIYLPSNEHATSSVDKSKGIHVPYTQVPGAYVDGQDLVIADQTIMPISEVKLIGPHNLENICAAVTAVWQVHQNVDAIRSVLASFSGLEHRLELAGEVKGVRYYDDSFGTTPDTAIVALDAFEESKVIIIGGHDKGNPFEDLAKRLTQSDVRHVVFIGNTGAKILDLALQAGFDKSKATIKDNGNEWTMSEILNVLSISAQPGDVALLSTGCASFGMFKDYKDRGQQFKECVKTLIRDDPPGTIQ